MNSPLINLVRLETEMSEVHLRLSGVVVENLPWADFLARYDSPETFFYLDPPYFGGESDYGKGVFSRADYAKMAELLAKIKGKFLLSINDVPEIRTSFAEFDVREVETTYTVARGKGERVSELLVMNYEPDAGLLGFCGEE